MKKFTVFVIAMFAALGVFAQFKQGRMLVGGSAEFSTTADKDRSGSTTVNRGNHTTLSLSPDFGYFFIDNLAVGAAIDMRFSRWNAKASNSVDNTTTSLVFQPFVRYYLPVPVFFQGTVGLGTSRTSYDENYEDSKYNTTSFGLAAGYVLFLTDNVALEPELGYRTSRYKNTESNVKDIDSGVYLRIGFQIYLK